MIVCVFDWACWVWSDCLRFWKYEVKKERVPGEKLNSFFSLSSSFLCETVSYALERSTYTANVGLCLCLSSVILSMIVCKASAVRVWSESVLCRGDYVMVQ